MNTATHLLLAAALFSREKAPTRNRAVMAGALAPDLSIFVFYGWAKAINGTDEREIWNTLYWTEPWQTLSALSNSIPLIALMLVIGIALKAPLVRVFALAALTHVILDLGFHATDAHRHFWPLTDWRFQSPISYWDTDHHGDLGGAIDLGLLVVSAAVLWRRFRAIWVRASLGLMVASLAATGIYFRLAFSCLAGA